MRLATVRTGDGTAAGRVEDGTLRLLPYRDVGELLASGSDWKKRAQAEAGDTVSTEDADFAPLILQPEKIACVGLNYRDHAAEAGLDVPAYPTIFAKYSRSLIGANDDVTLAGNSEQIDWEVELGVVVGAPVRNAGEADAQAAIAGYTIVNDVSMRDWQTRTTQFLQGKTFEASTPVGPYLVTPDELEHPLQLRMVCEVDGEVMQDGNSRELVFGPAAIVSYLSEITTLVPGDLIATGTPAGVGMSMDPPRFLSDGASLNSRIDGLGEQRNRCVAALLAS